MSEPNSWLSVVIKNEFGREIESCTVQHRYDTDHFDEYDWDKLKDGESKGGMKVGFWTGFARTGKDYWKVTFLCSEDKDTSTLWWCDYFRCTLLVEDVEFQHIRSSPVVLTISKKNEELRVAPPASSSTGARLHKETVDHREKGLRLEEILRK